MAYEDFKDLARRTTSDKFLRDEAFNIASNPNYDGYQRGLACMVYKLAEELHKPIIKKFKKRKVYSSFKDNIWGADLADM